MLVTAKGVVASIESIDCEVAKLTALVGNEQEKCINYNRLSGIPKVGDTVILNTTAVKLQLGTGGYHFIIANLSNSIINNINTGHIMKLKYTPLQINCLAVEAQESEYHNIFNEFESLNGFPVLVGTLHSMLAPCSIYMKCKRPEIKICYIMTDGGALPLFISDIVKHLQKDKVIEATVTYGNAFGGDFECVNIYTALITAKEIIKADIAVVCMGPGIVGTDTKFGFSGTEQGQIIDAVNRLGGYGILIPRISFSDNRERHYGISHHSITVLKDICSTKANVIIPKLHNKEQRLILKKQIDKNEIEGQHNIIYVDLGDIIETLSSKKNYFNKMGKGLEEDKEYFITCASAGKHALSKLN